MSASAEKLTGVTSVKNLVPILQSVFVDLEEKLSRGETPQAGDGSLDSILETQFNALNEKLNSLSTEISAFKQDIATMLSAKNDEIAGLKAQVCQLNNKVVTLENTLDNQDAYERKDTIIFSGDCIPPVTEGECCSKIIIE